MANRKKRLQKGIESLNEQIILHEKKRVQALEKGDIELADYYGKEIKTYKDNVSKKENQLNKQYVK